MDGLFVVGLYLRGLFAGRTFRCMTSVFRSKILTLRQHKKNKPTFFLVFSHANMPVLMST